MWEWVRKWAIWPPKVAPLTRHLLAHKILQDRTLSGRLSAHHGNLRQIQLHMHPQLGECILEFIDDGNELLHTHVTRHFCRGLLGHNQHQENSLFHTQTRPHKVVGGWFRIERCPTHLINRAWGPKPRSDTLFLTRRREKHKKGKLNRWQISPRVRGRVQWATEMARWDILMGNFSKNLITTNGERKSATVWVAPELVFSNCETNYFLVSWIFWLKTSLKIYLFIKLYIYRVYFNVKRSNWSHNLSFQCLFLVPSCHHQNNLFFIAFLARKILSWVNSRQMLKIPWHWISVPKKPNILLVVYNHSPQNPKNLVSNKHDLTIWSSFIVKKIPIYTAGKRKLIYFLLIFRLHIGSLYLFPVADIRQMRINTSPPPLCFHLVLQ